jgi:hypothetical protein
VTTRRGFLKGIAALVGAIVITPHAELTRLLSRKPPNRFTVPRDGIYLMGATVGPTRRADLLVNGRSVAVNFNHNPRITTLQAVRALRAGDCISVVPAEGTPHTAYLGAS